MSAEEMRNEIKHILAQFTDEQVAMIMRLVGLTADYSSIVNLSAALQ